MIEGTVRYHRHRQRPLAEDLHERIGAYLADGESDAPSSAGEA
jgi:hypothetical protein